MVAFVDERNKERLDGWMMPSAGYAWVWAAGISAMSCHWQRDRAAPGRG